MRRLINEEVFLSLVALAAAGVAPNIFPAAQAGMAKMSVLATTILLPSIVLLVVVFAIASFRGHPRLANRLLAGAAAGIVATVALEVVRISSFRLGGMPGDMPRLIGVLLTDRFMLGPSLGSDILGYAYHFWNGACFGMMFAVLFGRRKIRVAVGYAELIGLGFLAGLAVKALGVGFMGSQMPSMIVTVVFAHTAFGLVLGAILKRLLPDAGRLLSPPPTRQGAIAE